MGPKKVKKPQQQKGNKQQKAGTVDVADVGELSALATASFIEGLQQNNGAPLHSTALEEDLEPVEEKKSTKQQAPAKRKKNPVPVENGVNVKKAAKRKSTGDTEAARPEKKQRSKGKKKTTEAESGKSSEPQSQEESGGDADLRHREVFSSDEDLEESWKPSPKRLKVKGFGPRRSRTRSTDKSRKSSSGSGSQPEKRRKKTALKRSGVTELEVVLDEFLDFCERYKETVESKAVKQALDFFTSNVEATLTEEISSSQRLTTVMRENSKMASAIRTKRQRLLDAKNELLKSERQLCLLEKDKSELQQKLEDLSRSRTFLKNIRELNKRYLQHRRKRPDEKETYGASSLPALLIEAKQIRSTEPELRPVND